MSLEFVLVRVRVRVRHMYEAEYVKRIGLPPVSVKIDLGKLQNKATKQRCGQGVQAVYLGKLSEHCQ